MEMGALMTVVKRRIHNWHVAGSRRGYLQRKLTTLNVSATGLKNVEDAAFIHHIQKPVNSGESRNQNWWHLNFFWGLQGIGRASTPQTPALALTGEISGFNHPAVAHFEFMRDQISGGVVDKQILPAPTLCLAELKRPANATALSQVYQSDSEMVHDLAAAYHQIMSDLYQAGARQIQLNSCALGGRQVMTITELSTQVSQEAVHNLPADLCVQWHVTHGNCCSV